jgi:hypothetical protein
VAIDAAELLTLGADFARVWQDPSTDMRLKKRIVRTLVEEVVANVNEAGDTIEPVIHWKGGVHSTRRVRKNTTGHRRAGTEKTASQGGRSGIEGLPAANSPSPHQEPQDPRTVEKGAL